MGRLVKLYWPLILILSPTFARADSNPEALKHCNQGMAAFENGDSERALDEFAEAIRLDPKDPRPRGKRGHVYMFRKDFDRAIADFNAALQLDPKDLHCHRERGDAYFLKGDFNQAIADYEEAIRGGLKDEMLYSNRGSAYFYGRHDHERALADMNEAIFMTPLRSSLYCNRAQILAVMKDFNRAIADCNQAQRLAPTDANVYYSRGTVYGQQGELEKALADLNEAIRLAPQFAMAYYNRSNAYKDKKDYRSAIADCQEVIRLAPQHPCGYFALAWLLATCPRAEFRDGQKALEHAKKGCELAQWRDAGGLDALAVAYAELGDFDKAVHWDEKAQELAGNRPKNEQEQVRSRLQLFKQGKPYRME